MAGHPVFAAIYDRMFAAVEDGGLREIRARLLADASGRTLEVGAGTGLDLPHYPDAVSELVLTEPDPHMARRLRDAVASSPFASRARVVEAPAEALPFEAGSFDTVVSGLVLCSVEDPERTLAEIARVLCPGGRLLFLEHVRAPEGSTRARWQDRLERPWGLIAGGCHPNRRTVEAIAASELELTRSEDLEFPTATAALVRPLAVGVATRP